MDRYNFDDYISSYLDNELSESEKKKFEDIINSSSDCKMKFEETKKIILDIQKLPKLKTSENFIKNLNKRIDDEFNQEPKLIERFKGMFVFKPNLGFAMSIGFLFLVSYVLINNYENSTYLSSKPDTSLNDADQEQIYLSDIDSTDQDDEYEGEILQTRGQE